MLATLVQTHENLASAAAAAAAVLEFEDETFMTIQVVSVGHHSIVSRLKFKGSYPSIGVFIHIGPCFVRRSEVISDIIYMNAR